MAIYDVDAIMEAENQVTEEIEFDNDFVLDGMLEACENMISMLNESKARHRVVDVTKKQIDQFSKNSEIYDELSKAAKNVGNRQLANKYSDKSIENHKKACNKKEILDAIDQNRYKPGSFYERIAEENFKKLYNATPAKERNPGYYKDLYEKKKAIKETCLTILSVIDEM